MTKKECRYNKKHKFDTEDAQLKHEAICPDEKKRKDLKRCPFTKRHILPIKQYENHIKKCKYKPKEEQKVEKKDEKTNENIQNSEEWKGGGENVTQNNNNACDEWEGFLDDFGNNKNEKKKNDYKIDYQKLFNMDEKSITKNVFEEEDFIFSQCYV